MLFSFVSPVSVLSIRMSLADVLVISSGRTEGHVFKTVMFFRSQTVMEDVIIDLLRSDD
jgi:hypothetical protein